LDNITHSLAGIAIADAVMGKRAAGAQRPMLIGAGMIAANLPDIDILYSVITPSPIGYLLHHRGHTHTLVGLVLLGMVDAVQARPPRACRTGRLRFRAHVAVMHVLQPLVRTWGRARHRAVARRLTQAGPFLPGPMHAAERGTLLTPHVGPRAEVTAAAVAVLLQSGLRVAPGTGWEDFDARVVGGPFVVGDLLTSSHPQGWVQLRVRRRLRWPAVAAFLLLVGLVATADLLSVVIVLGAGLVEVVRELRRTRSTVHRVLKKAAA
jgi:hypothetical protein